MRAFIKKEFPKEEKIIYIVFGIWLLFLITSFALSSSFETQYKWIEKINPGTWGDSFGVINSLISVITFFLVYKTFGLQKEMLNSQKMELEATREELKGQKEIMNEGKFHQYFLFLMEHKELLKNTITKDITTWIKDTDSTSHSETETIRGEHVFYYWINDIRENNNVEYPEKYRKEREDDFNKKIGGWYKIHEQKLTIYIDFINLIKDELKQQNNEKYKIIIPTIQSSEEYQTFEYMRKKGIILNKS